ncbi:MAG: GreA/GreB family elongation factor [Patescibacteria group bacterium]
MNQKLYFTRRGWNKLQREKDELNKKLNRLQAQTAYVAEVGGDQYHDNASYDLLVIDIRGVDWRLTEAHCCLNQAVIVEPPSNADRVVIGTRVKIMRDGEETTWEIVGFGESDSDRGLLAYNTPVASLLMGKREGAVISDTIAGRKTKIEIIEISKGGVDESS